MVQIYRKKWQRGTFRALICYLRDILVCVLPIKRLPAALIRLLYGVEADFTFLVHPRNYQDVFISAPFLRPIKFILRREKAYKLVASVGPLVQSTVRTKFGINGLVIAQGLIPDVFLKTRKEVRVKLERMLKLSSKITKEGAIVGLGGWFPMFTRRGLSMEESAKRLGLVVTNGHLGTLISIYLTLERIVNTAGLKLSDLNVAVIGIGKMGSNVARILNGKVKSLSLIDIDKSNLEKIRGFLEKMPSSSEIRVYLSEGTGKDIGKALRETDIGVCATSTFRNLLRLRDIPVGYIAIDDSRPEALPRDPSKKRIILEGGLLKIEGTQQDYDYGFGEDDNVFGCLGEAFLLAIAEKGIINETLGEVDMKNFENAVGLCRKLGITEGDLKSGDTSVYEEEIRDALRGRRQKPAFRENMSSGDQVSRFKQQ